MSHNNGTNPLFETHESLQRSALGLALTFMDLQPEMDPSLYSGVYSRVATAIQETGGHAGIICSTVTETSPEETPEILTLLQDLIEEAPPHASSAFTETQAQLSKVRLKLDSITAAETLKHHPDALRDELERIHEEGSNGTAGHLRPWQELIHLADTTPFIVQDTIPGSGITAIYAPPNVGKSFWALELAVSIASGKPDFLSQAIHPDYRSTPVVYIAGEALPTNIRRISSWYSTDQIDTKDNLHFMDRATVNLGDPRTTTELKRDLKQIQPTLIVVDTLRSSFPNLAENESDDAQKMLHHCQSILATCPPHAALLFVHHSGKIKEAGLRGSSSFAGGVDALFLMEHASPTSDTILVKCEKQRTAARVDAHPFRLRLFHSEVTGRSARPEPVFHEDDPLEEEEESVDEDNTRSEIQGLIQLHPNGVRPSELVQLLGGTIKDRSLRRALNQLAQEGIIERRREGNGFVYAPK